jgi:hypothetical protein
MIKLDAEVTEIACPPNQAAQARAISVWVPDTEEHIEFTLKLEDFQSLGISEGDNITIKIEKKFDIDALARDLMNKSK